MTTKRKSFRSWAIGLVSCLLVLALVPVSARADETGVYAGDEPLPDIVLEDQDTTVAPSDDTSDKGQETNEAAGTATAGDESNAAQDAEADAPENLGLEVVPPAEGIVVEKTNEVQEVERQDGDAIEVQQDDDALPRQDAADVSLSAQSDTSQKARIAYRSHVADGMWSPYAYDGTVLQSIGSDGCIDGLKIKVLPGNTGVTGGVAYRMHVSKKGWLDWVQDGSRGGAGKGLRIEALQIKLTGDLATQYDVYYSVYLQGKGWMKWAKNGVTTGSVGMALRIEGIRIRLLNKGSKPSSKHVMFKSVLLEGSPVSVTAKVKGQGWLSAVGNNAVAGTTGQKLQLQGLKVTLPSAKVPGSVLVKGHIQETGWTGWNQKSVTASSSKRLEAIALKLSGEAKKKYDIYYRVHVSRIGWMAWATNGKPAGTKGLSVPIEAVQVYVAKKGAPAPSNDSVDVAYYTGTSLRYRAYCQSHGWLREVKSGSVAGTVGESKRMEAMTMRLVGGNIPGDINYEGFVAGSGWQGTVSNNAVAGTKGQSTALQAIKVSLGGLAGSMYDVWYRVHMSSLGWLGWAKNGEAAGAPRLDRSIEAIEVRLLPKGAAAPGSTDNHYVDVAGYDAQMLMRAQGYSSPTQWLILVDTDNTRLAVFRGSQHNWRFYDSWGVSCGKPTTQTVRGVFSVGDRGYVFGHGYSCYYYTQFYGGYLFHSIKYYEGTFDVMDGRIGEHISMGCVRMTIDHAKWIYDTIPSGTTVVTY